MTLSNSHGRIFRSGLLRVVVFTTSWFSEVVIVRKLFSSPVLPPAIAFIAPAFPSIYFTFVINDYNRGLVWDSAHYILSAQSLLSWLTMWLQGHYLDPAHIDLGPSLMVDGPVLPAFGAGLISLGNMLHLSQNMSILLGQTAVCGLNSLLLFFLAEKLTGNRKLSLIGALMFGFNPAAIVSASQFLTEQLTCTFLLALTSICTQIVGHNIEVSKDNTGQNGPLKLPFGFCILLGGLTTFLLQLKPALFPTVALILILALSISRQPFRLKAKTIAAMALGFAVCVMPWLIFSKLASGRISLAPNRVPSINLAVGMDLESDAWGVVPPTESVLPIIFDKPSAIVSSLWLARPFEITCMFLRKAERLFAYSWNDFGWPVLGVSAAGQCFLQRLLLCWAMLGAIYLLAQERLLDNKLSSLTSLTFLQLMILLTVAGHFIFLPFEAQPRYGFSALPYLILLSLIAGNELWQRGIFPWTFAIASFLCAALSGMEVTGRWVELTASLEGAVIAKNLLAAMLFGITVHASLRVASGLARGDVAQVKVAAWALGAAALASCFLTLKGEGLGPSEWACNLAPGKTSERQITIPREVAGQWQANRGSVPTWAAALIDADQSLNDARICINGKAALANPVALFDVPKGYSFESTISELSQMAAHTRGEATNSLRQWRLVQLPIEAVNLDGRKNVLTVSAQQKPLKIYGQYRYSDRRDKKLWIPSLYGFSALRLGLLGDSRTADIIRPRVAQSLSLYNGVQNSAGHQDLSPGQSGLQSGDYRLYLLLACSSAPAPMATQSGAQPAAKAATTAPSKSNAAPAMTLKDFFIEVF